MIIARIDMKCRRILTNFPDNRADTSNYNKAYDTVDVKSSPRD